MKAQFPNDSYFQLINRVFYTTFTLSVGGAYDYTDTAATDTYRFYRCRIGSLKSCNAVGYVDVTMPAGNSMISNPLNAIDNRVSAIFPVMPDGATLWKWDEINDQYFDANTFFAGYGWTDTNMILAPGEGCVMSLLSAATKSLVGEYLQGYLINSVPSGASIRASKTPISGPVASGLGAPILEGDIVTRMIGGVYKNFAYRNGIWSDDNGAQVTEPVINVGESFWINKPTDSKKISSVWP